jgi:hypothetical protein
MTEEIDHRAILARVAQIIDLLRTCHVRDGWKLDEEGAERTLRYFRHCADGGQDDDHEYMAASAFLYRNGQSRDRPMKRSRETLGLVAKTSEGQLMLICLVAFLCLGCAWAVDDGLFAAIVAIEAGSCGLREPLRFALRLIEPVLRIRALDTSKSRHQLVGG